jgi:mRNA interferase MazF
MNYKQGNVVLVKIIFSEGSGVKKRPAIIISDKYYHNHKQEVIIAAVTSTIDRRLLPGDTKIEDWQEAGLKYPSLVTGIIQTLKINIIERKLGHLSLRDFSKIQTNLKKSLGFK